MPHQRRHTKEKGKKFRKTRKQMGREMTIVPYPPISPLLKKS